MKRAAALLLCLVTVLGLVSCSKDTVTIEIPALFLQEEEIADLDGYAEQNGYLEAVYVKKNDTVKLKMTKMAYDLQLTNLGMVVIKALNGFVESETFPYLKSIDDFSDDFTEVTVSVDGEAYAKDETRSLLLSSVAEVCFMYGVYTIEESYSCTVTVKDAKTGEVLDKNTQTSA